MKPWLFLSLAALTAGAGAQRAPAEDGSEPLPPGVTAVWDLAKAHRETTATRERLSVNGLWRFQPAGPEAERPPADGWGHFKVPGCWPGITDYVQKDCQTVFAHPRWRDTDLRATRRVWYEREVAVPAAWAGRRIVLRAAYVNSRAAIHVDGSKLGEILFPAGEADLTAVCRPGEKHRLSLLVEALPLGAVIASFGDTAAPKEVRGSVARRGLCGDVWLESEPAGARIAGVRVETSVARGRIGVAAQLAGLDAERAYILRARVTERGLGVHEAASAPVRGADIRDGLFSLDSEWKPQRLWDLHTPENQLRLNLALVDADGEVLDAAYPEVFGFRELEIRGRDFLLNGTRLHLSALPLDNCEVGAAWASYEGARESLLRLKGIGINFVYTHNYGCEPGTHLSFAEALRAADDVGMLVALSQPHFGQYDWKVPDADRTNGYARHAEFYARVAGNHPSVVFYSMSHNATGYSEDMDPDKLDGASDARDSWARNNARLALRAEAIVKRLDPGRIVYHHASGNLGSMHTTNFYTNFAPIQELDDWFEGWATRGTKPLFTCEYMVPCTWDWTLYRGWYRGSREFGSAVVPWDYSIAEWSAQFLGDRAYRIGEPEKRNIRWEAKQYRDGKLWHRWDYPHPVGSPVFEAQHEIIGAYLEKNWRAFRGWGVSAVSPWEHHFYWSLRDGARKGRRALEVDWENLQRPGFSADYIDQVLERWDLAHERSDWTPTADGRAILRNNGPLLAWIAGKPEAFTSKDHVFAPGERFEKQIIAINDSREAVSCEARWSLGLPDPVSGSAGASIPPGEQRRVPMRFDLPGTLPPGQYLLHAAVRFGTGETQEDTFGIQVIPRPEAPRVGVRIALFDPRGESARLLDGMGVRYDAVGADADLAGHEVLVVGKGALTRQGPAPDIGRVREGLRVLLFEQTAEALERRFGFRVAEYGLRQVFERVPDHPLLAGLDRELLRDWRGAATLLPPRLAYELSPRLAQVPVVEWCGLEVSHVWRCGNRGNVASVIIEKPARGDFLPVVESGFGLQYSPLLEYREGKGLVVFCQMDVTGRTEADPAAARLAANLIERIASPSPPPFPSSDSVLLAGGGAAARAHLEAAGLHVAELEDGFPLRVEVMVLAPGTAPALAPPVADFLGGGGRLLILGLEGDEAGALLPFRVATRREEHIATWFEPGRAGSLTAGIGPADVHDRDPREIPLVSGGAEVIGNGVLARSSDANVVFCQLLPWEASGARGVLSSFVVAAEDAPEGKQSALVTVGSVSSRGARLGQKVTGLEPGKTYTLAALARGAGGPVTARLDVDRAGRSSDRTAARGKDTVIPEDAWEEIHVEFTVERSSGEGWLVGASSADEGARLRLDGFRLHEGTHWPGKLPDGARNLLANPGFEDGAKSWSFDFLDRHNARRTYRRASFLLARLLANLGAAGRTPLLERFRTPEGAGEKRWLRGFYLDEPEEWDDPYRFFRW